MLNKNSVQPSDNEDTVLSNDSSVHSMETEKTIFQTPPEEIKGNSKTASASPMVDAYVTAKKQLLVTREKQPRRQSVGLHSSSFCVPSSVGSPEDVTNPIPTMNISNDEVKETRKTVREFMSSPNNAKYRLCLFLLMFNFFPYMFFRQVLNKAEKRRGMIFFAC